MRIIKNYITANKFVFQNNRLLYCLNFMLGLVNVIEPILGLLFVQKVTNTFYYMNKSYLKEDLVELGIYLVGFVLIKIMKLIQKNVHERLHIKTAFCFYSKFYDITSRINYEYFEDNKYENIIYQTKEKTFNTIMRYMDNFLFYIQSLITLGIYIFFLRKINIWFALIYLMIFLGVCYWCKKKLEGQGRLWSEITPYRKRQNYFMNTILTKTAQQESKFNDLNDYFFHKWSSNYSKECDYEVAIYKKNEIANRISRVALYFPYIMMMLYVSIMIVLGKFEMGFLILCMDMFNNIINIFNGMLWGFSMDLGSMKFIEDAKDLFNIKIEESSYEKCKEFNQIFITNLSYTYPHAKKPSLQNISFLINRGEKISILGKNGSGKTTLVCTLLGLLQDNNQSLLIDGKSCRIQEEYFSVIFQDFIHYDMSLKENIQCGNSHRILSDEEINNILKKVQLYEYVQRLKDGIDTKLGQLYEGIELSKGQWQRIAIARLLANEKAVIWILDEPTAYLDPISEVNAYNLIEKYASDKTVLFISHRLGYSKKADKIIVIDKGKVIEEGNHNELISKNAEYYKIYMDQVNYMFREEGTGGSSYK